MYLRLRIRTNECRFLVLLEDVVNPRVPAVEIRITHCRRLVGHHTE